VGHTTALVRVCNPQDRARCLDLELIVDAGNTYTWIRRERLDLIGVRPRDQEVQNHRGEGRGEGG